MTISNVIKKVIVLLDETEKYTSGESSVDDMIALCESENATDDEKVELDSDLREEYPSLEKMIMACDMTMCEITRDYIKGSQEIDIITTYDNVDIIDEYNLVDCLTYGVASLYCFVTNRIEDYHFYEEKYRNTLPQTVLQKSAMMPKRAW